MGNNNCCAGRQQALAQFNKREKESINNNFKNLVQKYKITQGKNYLSREAIEDLFIENKHFGQNVFEFMRRMAECRNITYDVYVNSYIMTKDQDFVKGASIFKSLDKIELYAIIMQGFFDIKIRDEFRRHHATYAEALEFMKELLRIFIPDGLNRKISDVSAKALVDPVIKSNKSISDWNSLINHLRNELPLVCKALKKYFCQKLITLAGPLKLPKLSNSSYILNDELLSLIALSNFFVYSSHKLSLIYSNTFYGFNFEKLVEALLANDCPTLILLRHNHIITNEKDGEKSKFPYVFGCFTKAPWKNSQNYQGNDDCYIFSLIPKLKSLYAVNEGGEQIKNYSYLYYSKKEKTDQVQGLGFGGKNFRNFRLWLDANDIVNKSYCTPSDSTYRKGSLVASQIKNLHISNLEVWGVSKEVPMKTELFNISLKTNTFKNSTHTSGTLNLESKSSEEIEASGSGMSVIEILSMDKAEK